MKKTRILAINPGSTTTKIALYDDCDELFCTNIEHSAKDMKAFKDIWDQHDYRREMIEKTMAQRGFSMSDIDVFVGRGGGIHSVTSGIYEVTDLLVEHTKLGIIEPHPAKLTASICRLFADLYGGRAFIVNPPDVDEFEDVARVSGIKGIYRGSHLHALNQKEIALRFCAERGLEYENVNLVICHLGGGISVTAHKKGRMVDSNDIIKGSGPMTPTRAGDLPYINVINMAYSGEYTKQELIDKLNKHGGLTDYFGTADIRDVYKMIDDGDKLAKIILDGMIYQNAKYAGAMAVALKGEVDAIILTGGISNSAYFTGKLKEYVGWIAEIVVMAGEFELEALTAGALRVVRGEEDAKIYSGKPIWSGFES